jgi:hypothetical protein
MEIKTRRYNYEKDIFTVDSGVVFVVEM